MRDLTLSTADGIELVATQHDAPQAVAQVVLAGAMAVPCRAYRRLGERFARKGLSVLRFDYRGIGVNGPASRSATATSWAVHDVGAALGWAYQQDLPVLYLGHSFGGQALGLVEGGERLAAVLTVGAQLGYWGLWDGASRAGMWLFWHAWLPPITRAFGVYPAWAGMKEAIPAGVALEWARWGRSPGYLLDHVPDAAARFDRVDCPARAIAITDDGFAPPRAVAAFAACLPGAHVHTLQPEGSMGHFGFFKSQPHVDQAADWLLAQL